MTCGARVRAVLYIYQGPTRVAGPGLFEALQAIRETGSLRAAAERLGMSYRRLWERIRRAERLLGARLVERGRRGSRLTREAEKLLQAYAEALERLQGLGLLEGVDAC